MAKDSGESDQSDSGQNVGVWVSVVLSALLIIGMLLFAWLLDEKHDRVLEKLTWPTVTAFASAVNVKTVVRASSSDSYVVRVKYQYVVEGADGRYETDWRNVFSSGRETKSESVAHGINLRVKEGRPLKRVVLYDPEDPSKSSFRNSTASRIAWSFVPLIGATGALIWLVVSLTVLTIRKLRSMAP